LAALGHDCVGIDFSPASIEYARKSKPRGGGNCQFRLEDIRTAIYGSGFDLVMLIFGEFNVFRPEEAREILCRANGALSRAGQIVLEPSTYDAIRAEGKLARSWSSASSGLFGLFSDRPHLYLTEHFWDDDAHVATTRYFVVETDGCVTGYAASAQAYSDEKFRTLLAGAGFVDVRSYPSLMGGPDPDMMGLTVFVARKSL
jgi:hypothetical protein